MKEIRRACLIAFVMLASILAVARLSAEEPTSKEFPVPVKKPAELKFQHSSFTFVRIKHSDQLDHFRRTSWMTDYPDSDLNLSARFTKDTGLKSDPQGKVLSLTDPELKKFPFIYMVEVGRLVLSDAEAKGLRDYLLGGGFLLVDDFWGDAEWDNFAVELKKVFPDREPKELPLDHPVFHCFYDLSEKPQVPSIHVALTLQATKGTSERPDAVKARFQGISDDRGRLVALICHNTDLGDGWERADVSEYYFREFCQKKAYPMGVNILVYTLTQPKESVRKE
jgi:Domain of unknown function (DUF4159)